MDKNNYNISKEVQKFPYSVNLEKKKIQCSQKNFSAVQEKFIKEF